jgi:uncharacterized BrkB/YihY/UPF0761 family membrane protein
VAHTGRPTAHVVLLKLWRFLSGLALIVGAGLNGELEREKARAHRAIRKQPAGTSARRADPAAP